MEPDAVQRGNKPLECRLILLGALRTTNRKSLDTPTQDTTLLATLRPSLATRSSSPILRQQHIAFGGPSVEVGATGHFLVGAETSVEHGAVT